MKPPDKIFDTILITTVETKNRKLAPETLSVGGRDGVHTVGWGEMPNSEK